MSLFSTMLAVTSTGTAISPLAAVMMSRRIRRASVLATVAASVSGLAGVGVVAGAVVPDLAQFPALTTVVGLLLGAAVVVSAVWLLRSAVTVFVRPRSVPAMVSGSTTSRSAVDEFGAAEVGQGRFSGDRGQLR